MPSHRALFRLKPSRISLNNLVLFALRRVEFLEETRLRRAVIGRGRFLSCCPVPPGRAAFLSAYGKRYLKSSGKDFFIMV